LQTLIAEKNAPEKGLRVFVEKGGCAGLQYGMTLDDPSSADEIIEQAGVRVIVDPESASFLHGATLDYVDDLAGAGFRLNNPNAARSCGCGTSFEPAQAEAAGEQASPAPA
jgi:iron-sulfur cluster assembly accessory protein